MLRNDKSRTAILSISAVILLVSKNLAFGQYLPEEQPYNVDRVNCNQLINSTSSCLRVCQPGKSRLCYYKFHVESYTVLGRACQMCPQRKEDCSKPQCVTADGFERAILTANRRLPGPSIQVCKGDRIVVDVINQMPGRGTTIHWHGIKQRLTPWMDGVPMVTQCPIMESQTFRYGFVADEPGTYFWHSHDGLQKVDGLQGSLIIREPDSENVLRDLYDFDLPCHIVFIQDWLHDLADSRYPGQETLNRGQSPNSYLINGYGIQMNAQNGSNVPQTPLAKFNVLKGKRYRFRIIGGTCLSCPARISFQNHKVTLINTDGYNPLQPVTVDTLEISSGERYDVVLEASREVGVYGILVQGLEEECLGASQLALLCYEGAECEPVVPLSSYVVEMNPGYTLNPHKSECNDKTLSSEVCISQLRSLLHTPKGIRKVPDKQLIVTFNFHDYTYEELYNSNVYHRFLIAKVGGPFTSLVNNVSHSGTPSPLLTQHNDIPSSKFCSRSTCKNEPVVCECCNVIKVSQDDVVEMLILDESIRDSLNMSHPFHLHGHDFYVISQGRFNLTDKNKLISSELRKSAEDLPLSKYLPSKDSLIIPYGGYSRIRFIADNPGFWLFHCHFNYHMDTGMAAVIQVGDLSEMPRAPSDFPRCNEYLPSFRHLFK